MFQNDLSLFRYFSDSWKIKFYLKKIFDSYFKLKEVFPTIKNTSAQGLIVHMTSNYIKLLSLQFLFLFILILMIQVRNQVKCGRTWHVQGQPVRHRNPPRYHAFPSFNSSGIPHFTCLPFSTMISKTSKKSQLFLP